MSKLVGWLVVNATGDEKIANDYYDKLYVACKSFDISLYKYDNVSAYIEVLKGNKPNFMTYWDKDYKLARFFEKQGIRVYNSSKSIELCDDKAKTYIELLNNGIKQPKTFISPYFYYQDKFNIDSYVDYAISILGENIVVKECCSSYGYGVKLSTSRESLKNIILEFGTKPYILQEQIKSSFAKDIKVEIIGDFYCAMKRVNTNGDFRANLFSGGTGENYTLNENQLLVCRKAIEVLGLNYGGVDLLFGENDEPILCEVNSNASFLHIGEICNVDIPHHIIEYIYNDLI